MNSFYEKYRDDDQSLVLLYGETFPSHFHNNLEVLLVRRGKTEVLLNERVYEVTDGCVLVIDSYDLHTYQVLGEGEREDRVVMIPYKYLLRFNAGRRNLRIANPLIRDEKFCEALLRFTEEYLARKSGEGVREAAVELFLALLSERLEFAETKSGDERALVRKILAYVQENYRGDVTRSTIARALGYTESHVSRVFHRYIKRGIAEYVNGLRLEYIDRMRAAGDERTTIELIYEAGFKSQQTYYRARKKADDGK